MCRVKLGSGEKPELGRVRAHTFSYHFHSKAMWGYGPSGPQWWKPLCPPAPTWLHWAVLAKQSKSSWGKCRKKPPRTVLTWARPNGTDGPLAQQHESPSVCRQDWKSIRKQPGEAPQEAQQSSLAHTCSARCLFLVSAPQKLHQCSCSNRQVGTQLILRLPI